MHQPGLRYSLFSAWLCLFGFLQSPGGVTASFLPELGIFLPYYARLLASMGNLTTGHTSTGDPSASETTIHSLTESLNNRTGGPGITPGRLQESGQQLKAINDRIILLLVFNNVLLDMVASLEGKSEKGRDTVTPHAMTPHASTSSQQASRLDLDHHQHRRPSSYEIIPMASMESRSSSPFSLSPAGRRDNVQVLSDNWKVTPTSTTVKPTTLWRALPKSNPNWLKASSPPFVLNMKGSLEKSRQLEKGRANKASNLVPNLVKYEPTKTTQSPPERVVYITDANDLISPELREYIEAIGNRKRLKVVFGQKVATEEAPGNESGPIPEEATEELMTLNEASARESAWTPIYPYHRNGVNQVWSRINSDMTSPLLESSPLKSEE